MTKPKRISRVLAFACCVALGISSWASGATQRLGIPPVSLTLPPNGSGRVTAYCLNPNRDWPTAATALTQVLTPSDVKSAFVRVGDAPPMPLHQALGGEKPIIKIRPEGDGLGYLPNQIEILNLSSKSVEFVVESAQAVGTEREAISDVDLWRIANSDDPIHRDEIQESLDSAFGAHRRRSIQDTLEKEALHGQAGKGFVSVRAKNADTDYVVLEECQEEFQGTWEPELWIVQDGKIIERGRKKGDEAYSALGVARRLSISDVLESVVLEKVDDPGFIETRLRIGDKDYIILSETEEEYWDTWPPELWIVQDGRILERGKRKGDDAYSAIRTVRRQSISDLLEDVVLGKATDPGYVKFRYHKDGNTYVFVRDTKPAWDLSAWPPELWVLDGARITERALTGERCADEFIELLADMEVLRTADDASIEKAVSGLGDVPEVSNLNIHFVLSDEDGKVRAVSMLASGKDATPVIAVNSGPPVAEFNRHVREASFGDAESQGVVRNLIPDLAKGHDGVPSLLVLAGPVRASAKALGLINAVEFSTFRPASESVKMVEQLAEQKLRPSDFQVFSGLPTNPEEYRSVFPDHSQTTIDERLPAYQEAQRQLQTDSREFGAQMVDGLTDPMDIALFLKRIKAAKGVIFIDAHHEGGSVWLPAFNLRLQPADFEGFTFDSHPLILLRVCNGADPSAGLVQAFMKAGASGVWANTEAITAGEAVEQFRRIMQSARKGNDTVLQILERELKRPGRLAHWEKLLVMVFETHD